MSELLSKLILSIKDDDKRYFNQEKWNIKKDRLLKSYNNTLYDQPASQTFAFATSFLTHGVYIEDKIK